MTEAGTPLAARNFRYPPGPRRAYFAAALAAGAMAAGAVALQLAPRVAAIERLQLLVFAAGFGTLAYHAAEAVRIMAGGVRVADAGVGPAGGELVPWGDVVVIEIRPVRQRMDVYVAGGRRLLSLRPELDSFAAVQSQIIGRMEPRGCTPPCTIPLISSFAGAPIGILTMFLAVWFGPRQGGVPAAICAAVSLVAGLLYLARRRSIRVERDGVVLKEGLRRFAIRFSDVSAVHVQARPRTGGGAVHYVVLEREHTDAIPIAGFRRGYNEAFRCIEPAWLAARGGNAGG